MAGGTPAEISTQFGPDWLCELGDKSYKPQFFFSISMKNGCLVVYNFVIKVAWTFFFYHYMLGTTVTQGPVKCLHLGTLHSGPGTMVPQTWYPRVWYPRVRYPVLGTQQLGPFIWYLVPGTQGPVKRFCSVFFNIKWQNKCL